MAEKTYEVQWLLQHDQRDYHAGEKVTIDEADAAPLVKAGVLVLSGRAAKKQPAQGDQPAADAEPAGGAE